jgi:hypothetical protein
MNRILAILSTYNEERFIAACLENLIRQGLDVHLIDNESTDRTCLIAREYLGKGLITIESLARDGIYRWKRILSRKAEIAESCDYDWFMHVDADEIRLPPRPATTISEAVRIIDSNGFNAVNFIELCFVPTREEPDHDHPRFQQTMRWYYPFCPSPNNRLNLWKRQPMQVDLSSSGGHTVSFPELRVWPGAFPMRHYLFLSTAHAREKWVERVYDPDEIERGWHRSRARLASADIRLQSRNELRLYRSDTELDTSEPMTRHPVFAAPEQTAHDQVPERVSKRHG